MPPTTTSKAPQPPANFTVAWRALIKTLTADVPKAWHAADQRGAAIEKIWR